jgi:hypothetical protein
MTTDASRSRITGDVRRTGSGDRLVRPVPQARDPIHPFSDSDRTARELPHARLVEAHSLLEWRVSPARLDRELLQFLDEVWQPQRAVA